MPVWEVKGANLESSEDVVLKIKAPNEEAVRDLAKSHGVLVEGVKLLAGVPYNDKDILDEHSEFISLLLIAIASSIAGVTLIVLGSISFFMVATTNHDYGYPKYARMDAPVIAILIGIFLALAGESARAMRRIAINSFSKSKP